MISEVPLGAFLSGGVDSSAVVATMAGLSAEPGQHLLDRVRRSGVRRVALCAQQVARALSHPPFRRARRERRLRPHRQARAALRRAVRRQLGDSDLPRLPARAQARDGRAVGRRRRRELRRLSALSPAPDGGADARARCRWRCAGRCSACSAAPIPRPTGRRGCSAPSRRSRRWRATRSRPISTACRSCATTCGSSSSATRSARSSAATTRSRCSTATRAARDTDDPLALVQYLDLKTYLVGDINTKVDRASMAHSLEVREPLMDHPLVEWLATLPSSLKMRGQEGKWLLKKAMEPHLPHEHPLSAEDGLRRAARALVPRPAARARARRRARRPRSPTPACSTARYLRDLVDSTSPGARDYSAPLWTLLMFDAFLRNVVDAPGGSPLRRLPSRRHAASHLDVLDHSLRAARRLASSPPDSAAMPPGGTRSGRRAILREQRALGWKTLQLAPPGAPCGLQQAATRTRSFHRLAERCALRVAARLRRLGLAHSRSRDLGASASAASRTALASVSCAAELDRLPRHSPVLNALPALRAPTNRQQQRFSSLRRPRTGKDAAVEPTPDDASVAALHRARARDLRAARADHVTTICEGLRDEIVARGMAPSGSPYSAMRSTLDEFGSGAEARRRHCDRGASASTARPCIGFAGSFYAYEGLDLLIEAAALLVPRLPELPCCWSAAAQEQALSRIAPTRLADRVIFAGRVPHGDVQRYYDLIDVLAYPRHRDAADRTRHAAEAARGDGAGPHVRRLRRRRPSRARARRRDRLPVSCGRRTALWRARSKRVLGAARRLAARSARRPALRRDRAHLGPQRRRYARCCRGAATARPIGARAATVPSEPGATDSMCGIYGISSSTARPRPRRRCARDGASSTSIAARTTRARIADGPLRHRHAAAVDHRPRRRASAARPTRTARCGSSPTARSTTTGSCAASSTAQRPPLQDRLRLRDHPAPVRSSTATRSSST